MRGRAAPPVSVSRRVCVGGVRWMVRVGGDIGGAVSAVAASSRPAGTKAVSRRWGAGGGLPASGCSSPGGTEPPAQPPGARLVASRPFCSPVWAGSLPARRFPSPQAGLSLTEKGKDLLRAGERPVEGRRCLLWFVLPQTSLFPPQFRS